MVLAMVQQDGSPGYVWFKSIRRIRQFRQRKTVPFRAGFTSETSQVKKRRRTGTYGNFEKCSSFHVTVLSAQTIRLFVRVSII
jgi:hypothetical protein